MNLLKKIDKINSLLGDISSTGITPLPDIVYSMRILLEEMKEEVEYLLQEDHDDLNEEKF